MLEDAAGIRRVVLACGTVDLRKGIDGLATIIMVKIHLRREHSFCFAGSVLIGAKGSCGWVPGFYFCINALKRDGYPGQGIRRKQRILPRNSTSIS